MKKIFAIILVATSLFGSVGCSSNSASIGIIGGADGPTAIFVTGDFSWLYLLLAGIVIAAIVLLWWFKRKR